MLISLEIVIAIFTHGFLSQTIFQLMGYSIPDFTIF